MTSSSSLHCCSSSANAVGATYSWREAEPAVHRLGALRLTKTWAGSNELDPASARHLQVLIVMGRGRLLKCSARVASRTRHSRCDPRVSGELNRRSLWKGVFISIPSLPIRRSLRKDGRFDSFTCRGLFHTVLNSTVSSRPVGKKTAVFGLCSSCRVCRAGVRPSRRSGDNMRHAGARLSDRAPRRCCATSQTT